MATGNALRALSRTLRALAAVPSKVSAPFADYITKELQANIRKGVDPYDKALTPLKTATVRRKGHSRILIGETLALLTTTVAKALSGGGVGLEVGPPYAHFHITGTLYMVARAFLPINVMPAKWRAKLRELLAARVKARLA